MIRSVSQNRNLDKEASLNFTNYSDDFQNQRNSRTLSLRRSNRPLLSVFKLAECKSKISLELPRIETSFFLEVFNSGDETKIMQLSDIIIKTAQVAPLSLSNITSSNECMEAFGNAFVYAESDNLVLSLLNSTSLIFPSCESEVEVALIDTGISMKFISLLLSTNNLIVIYTINLITAISKISSYGRDSLMCLGVPDSLISIAKSNINEDITIGACVALETIYRNQKKIEGDSNDINELSESCVDCIIYLIQLPYVQAVNAILSILSTFASSTQLVKMLIMRDIDLIAIQYLKIPELTEKSIYLLGSMCTLDLKYAQRLRRMFEEIVKYLQTEFAAVAFWAMANIYEVIPNELQIFITPDFIQIIIEIGTVSNYQVQKMVAFFMATVLYLTNSVFVANYAIPELINILIVMLGCGETNIIKSCIHALDRLIDYVDTSHVVNMFETTDIVDNLDELIKNQPHDISVIANCLYQRVCKIM